MTHQVKSFLERNAWSLVTTTIPLCVGLGMMYSGIVNRIDKNQELNEQRNKFQDEQIMDVKQTATKNTDDLNHVKDFIYTLKQK